MVNTMYTSKPTIIFVTGAWHKPHLYTNLLSGLQKTRFPVIAPPLPSVGGTTPSFDADVDTIRAAIADEVSEGHEVIMLMHSYGGMVGSAASEGYAKDQVRNGGVIRMIYMAAFALDEGVSLMDALHHTPLPWWVSANKQQWRAIDTQQIFYNDVDPVVAGPLEKELDLQAKGAFESKQTYAAWKHIDSTYIVCEYDLAIPMQAQLEMANQSGSKCIIVYLKAGHSPFLSMPQQTVNLIRRTAGEPM